MPRTIAAVASPADTEPAGPLGDDAASVDTQPAGTPSGSITDALQGAALSVPAAASGAGADALLQGLVAPTPPPAGPVTAQATTPAVSTAHPALPPAAAAAVSLVRGDDGADQVVLHLVPDTLGAVTVTLTRHADGQTSVVFTATSPDTLHALASGQDELRTLVRDAGLRPETAQLSFELDSRAVSPAAGSEGSGAGDLNASFTAAGHDAQTMTAGDHPGGGPYPEGSAAAGGPAGGSAGGSGTGGNGTGGNEGSGGGTGGGDPRHRRPYAGHGGGAEWAAAASYETAGLRRPVNITV